MDAGAIYWEFFARSMLVGPNNHAGGVRRLEGCIFIRLTRLTNAFSKKLDNLKAALALHFAWYNFVRVHRTLRVTPAMAAGVSDRLWSLEELVARTTN